MTSPFNIVGMKPDSLYGNSTGIRMTAGFCGVTVLSYRERSACMVYVIGKNGQPLMPTCRHGKVKHLLNEGKAKVVKRCPFTIKLLYESKAHTQNLTLGRRFHALDGALLCFHFGHVSLFLSCFLTGRAVGCLARSRRNWGILYYILPIKVNGRENGKQGSRI